MADGAEVTDLIALGLTKYEAKGYLALTGREHASATEIAQLAGIPRQRIYDVLNSLSERGLVVAAGASEPPARGMRYRAQPPDQVIDRLLAVRKRELDQLMTSGKDLAGRLLPRFLSGQTNAGPLDYVEVIKDPQLAVECVEELWAKAEYEVLTFVRPPYLAPPEPEEATTPPVIRPRAIYETSFLDDPEMVGLVRAFEGVGEEVRIVDGLPLKMTVVDESAAAFNMPDPVSDDGSSVTTLIVRHPALAASLKITFETLWAQGKTLDEALQDRAQ